MAKKKKQRKTKKENATKVILMTDEETDQEDIDEEGEESGIYLDKESVQIIYNALSKYKPNKDEENVYGYCMSSLRKCWLLTMA